VELAVGVTPAVVEGTAGAAEGAVEAPVADGGASGAEAGGEGGAADGPLVTAKVSGFVDSRWTGGYASVARPLPSDDFAHLQGLTEANVLLKLAGRGGATGLVDLSLVHARGWMYWGAAADGARLRLADHDVASLRPAAIVSEAYGILPMGERLNLTLGKKRVLWGPGLAWNPTDLLNPPKDPTDPALQRAGTWLARLELPMDTWTVSLVAAAKTTRQFGGVPSGLVWYPDNLPAGESRDDEPHFALGARLYALVAETDLNAMVFLTHLYNDAFRYKPRFGLSASHVFFDSLETHVEVLGQSGSARSYFDGDCVASLQAAMGCGLSGRAVAATSRLDDGALRLKTLAGVRWQIGENAAISAEWFYNAEGYDKTEFRHLAQVLSLRRDALAQGVPAATLAQAMGGGLGFQAVDPGTPQKFSFEPLRRHYLFLTYLHPQLADDFTINTVVILGLEDLSGQLAPQLTWSARQWLNLTIGGFVALPGAPSLGVAAGGSQWTEYGLQPALWRVFAAARVFY
jgi:hypothetical protein